VTLTRLVLAWISTAVWFAIATLGIARLVARVARPPSPSPFPRRPGMWARAELSVIRWRMVEAALLTLVASLWFDSLGSGGWWLLFLLVGALATIPTWLPTHPEREPTRLLLVGACADLARYLLAGAILAWRLG
jgi:hypothetical protein